MGRRGYVRLFTAPTEGTVRVLIVQGPGTTFNEAAVCDGGPALVTARALTQDTYLDEVPAALVSQLLTTNPRLSHNLVQALTSHIRRLATLVGERPLEEGVH